MVRKLLGVAGFPIAHSRSPAMQNAALRELGIDWLYVPVPLAPERFAETVRSLPLSGFRGLNVTLPHKQAAHDLADELSGAAAAIGAANTLTFRDGAIVGDNTDADGLLDALEEPVSGRRALVLGAGGSARAAVWALQRAGAAEVSVWNRTSERARELAGALGARHVERPQGADLLVHGTTVGLDPVPRDEALAVLGLAGMEPPGTVVDLVYARSPSPVLSWAEAGGARTVDGLEVLVRQGARSLALWTGREPPLEAMRRAAREAP